MESSRRDLLNDMAEHRPILKTTKMRTIPLFFRIDLCSSTSMESSRRDLSNYMAEHRPIFKIKIRPVLFSLPKQVTTLNRCLVFTWAL